MHGCASYNHFSHELNVDCVTNKSYVLYINFIHRLKSENANFCNKISFMYNHLILSTNFSSIYPLSESILFILRLLPDYFSNHSCVFEGFLNCKYKNM